MPYKKTNEVWFGDSFNRPYTVACYSANGDEVMKGYIKDCDLSLSADSATEVNCTFDLATGLNGTTCGMASNDAINIKGATDSFATEIKRIDAQINDLKQNFVPKKGANKLRSALKTLKYKREVE